MDFFDKIKISAFVLVILLFGWITCAKSFNDHEFTITITDKERANYFDSSKFLVWGETPEGESLVFENTDSFMRGKFDSATIQGKLKENHTYRITVIGWRIPFFSDYENIISFQEIKNS